MNVPLKVVTLGTVSSLIPGTPRVYEFTSFVLPIGWTALATGKYPLQIECSGNVTIDGTIDLSGAPGAVYTTGQIAGGAAGAANCGGGAGSTGGSVVDASGVDNPSPARAARRPIRSSRSRCPAAARHTDQVAAAARLGSFTLMTPFHDATERAHLDPLGSADVARTTSASSAGTPRSA